MILSFGIDKTCARSKEQRTGTGKGAGAGAGARTRVRAGGGFDLIIIQANSCMYHYRDALDIIPLG